MKELLNLDFLNTFIKVAEYKELKKVAEELYKSPSTVSTQIKRLEEQTNSILINRTNDGIKLTEKGKIVLKYAKEMIQLNDELLRKVSFEQLKDTINIGIPTDYVNLFNIHYLSKLKEVLPNVKPKVFCDRSRTLRKKINTDQLDIAIVVNENNNNQEFNLWKEQMYWVCGKNFNFKDYKIIPIAIFSDNCILRDITIKTLKSNKIKYKEVFSSPVLDNIVSFVKTDQAISLLSENYIKNNDFTILPESIIPSDMELSMNLVFSESYDMAKKELIKDLFLEIKTK